MAVSCPNWQVTVQIGDVICQFGCKLSKLEYQQPIVEFVRVYKCSGWRRTTKMNWNGLIRLTTI